MFVRKRLHRILMTKQMHRRIATVALCVIATWSTVSASHADTISNSGLLAEYSYETSGGVGVADGQSAAGAQVDDTGFNLAGPNYATGSPFSQIPNLLTYSTDVAGGVGSGRALSFPLPESNLDYVSVPIPQGSALDDIGTGDFYIQAYFKTTDTNRANIFSSYSTGAPNSAFNLELHTGNRVRIYLQDSTGGVDQINSTAPGVTYADNEWHKIIAVRESNILTLTLDGVIVGDPIVSNRSFEQTNSEFRIGQDNRGATTPRYTGLLDDILLTNTNNSLFGRVAAYNFDTAGGVATAGGASAVGTIDDTGGNAGGPFSGIAAAGSPATEPVYRADVPAVLAGSSAYSFEVQESGVESASFSVTPEVAAMTQGDFTIETWFKTTDTGRGAMIGDCCTTPAAGTGRIGLELHTGNRVRLWINGPTATTDANFTAPDGIDTRDGEWHLAIAKRENGIVSVWVDGVLAGSQADTAGDFDLSSLEDIYIGRDARTGSTRFDGMLDNTRIWTRALSEAEIVKLAGGAVPVPEPSSMVLVMVALVGLIAGGRRRRANRAIPLG